MMQSVQRMGERIRKKREILGFQVKDLSSKIDVTPSLISQIERAKAFPSIITLKKIADALETTVGELIGENESLVRFPQLKSDERKFVKKNSKGTSLFLLSHHDNSKQIEPYLIVFKGHTNSKKIMTSNHPGQEFCFVLNGNFKVTLGDKKFLLNEGDSFYFNSNQYHLFTNTGEEEAELLWVIVPSIKH